MTSFTARKHVGTEFPPTEGIRLARVLLTEDFFSSPAPLKVDLRGCSPATLISAFFNGFLQVIVDEAPHLLEAARGITWETDYAFQETNIERWVTDFQPNTAPATASA